MAKVKLILDAEGQKLWSAFRRTQTEQEKVARKSKRIADESKKQERAQQEMLKSIRDIGAGLLGVSGTVAAIHQGYQTWVEDIRKVADAARAASNEIVAFASLAAGGTKADEVFRAQNVAMQFGVTDRAAAFDILQAMKSAAGTLEGGIPHAAQVFQAAQLGVPLATAKELEVQSILGGSQVPGDLLRKVFIAGEESVRSPELLALASKEVQFFDDTTFAAGAMGVLGKFDREIPTYVKAAGQALSLTGAQNIRPLAEPVPLPAGFAGPQANIAQTLSSQRERLQFLHDFGLRTTDDVAGVGVSNVRQQAALGALLQNMDMLDRISAVIDAKSGEFGILGRKRAEIESELPFTGEARVGDRLRAAFEAEVSGTAGPESAARAAKALREQNLARARGVALRRLGITSAFGVSPFQESGEVFPFGFFRARASVGLNIFGELEPADLDVATELILQEFQGGETAGLPGESFRDAVIRVRRRDVGGRQGSAFGDGGPFDENQGSFGPQSMGGAGFVPGVGVFGPQLAPLALGMTRGTSSPIAESFRALPENLGFRSRNRRMQDMQRVAVAVESLGRPDPVEVDPGGMISDAVGSATRMIHRGIGALQLIGEENGPRRPAMTHRQAWEAHQAAIQRMMFQGAAERGMVGDFPMGTDPEPPAAQVVLINAAAPAWTQTGAPLRGGIGVT